MDLSKTIQVRSPVHLSPPLKPSIILYVSPIIITNYLQGAKISNLFLDPSGHHLLISLKSSETEAGPSLYYLHTKWQQPRLIVVVDDDDENNYYDDGDEQDNDDDHC